MAGDWIKMRTDLYRDPKVSLIADYLLAADSALSHYVNHNMQRDITVTRNVMRNMAVGALVSVWGVLRHRGKRDENDLVIKFCGLGVIDDLSDIPGFGAAMESVGWVVDTGESLVLPSFFEEFNVDPTGDAKAKNAERQRKHREKMKLKNNVTDNVTDNVTVASQSNPREEKNREEKSINIKPKVLNNNNNASEETADDQPLENITERNDERNADNKTVESKTGDLAEFDISRFTPSASEITYCERLELDTALAEVLAEFRVYHSDNRTRSNAAGWSRSFLGWVKRRVIPPVATAQRLELVQ